MRDPTPTRTRLRLLARLSGTIALLWLGCGQFAQALPSFAQQTGLPCAQCHTIAFGPALTAYGRQFKLNGYALGEKQDSVPLALMAVLGYTHTQQDQPEPPADRFGTNDNLALNELTGFFAGHLGEHAGAFIEVAYSGVERKAAWGAFDVRYSHALELAGHGVVAGVTINNNPTVTDLWNSTPVWSFPYTGSELAPTPGAAPIFMDGISEKVLGTSVYAMYNDLWYVELGGYWNLSNSVLNFVGVPDEDNAHVKGTAPYWRTALQFTHGASYYSVGMMGLYVKQKPDDTSPETNNFNDIGFDATYQYVAADASNLAANLSFIHENRNLKASVAAEEAASASGHLDSLRLDVTYTLHQTWVFGGGWFDTSGSSDDVLYSPGELEGSRAGVPDSRGYTLQLEYVPFGKLDSRGRPWMNLRFGLQYLGYSRFNGGTSDYDGFGRSASDNNTLFAFVWAAL